MASRGLTPPGTSRVTVGSRSDLSDSAVRLLFLADTHLGFDLPRRPRVARRRRGQDFLANYHRVLDAALRHRVHMVVHGGDLLYRSRVPAALVQEAVLPLKRIADTGIDVYVVPGNHERSRIPFAGLIEHPRVHVFDRPRTFVASIAGFRVALAGFPFCRDGVRRRFVELVEATRWRFVDADLFLLCVHQCFEGATVGPSDHTFRGAPDVVRVREVPPRFAAVLSGHIHRHQVLERDLAGRALCTPVLYPGSIERTSFAERDESKGYVILTHRRGDASSDPRLAWQFRPLPSRPMIVEDLHTGGLDRAGLESALRRAIDRAPSDAVLRLRLHGELSDNLRPVVAAPSLRALAPPTMNVEAVLADGRHARP